MHALIWFKLNKIFLHITQAQRLDICIIHIADSKAQFLYVYFSHHYNVMIQRTTLNRIESTQPSPFFPQPGVPHLKSKHNSPFPREHTTGLVGAAPAGPRFLQRVIKYHAVWGRLSEPPCKGSSPIQSLKRKAAGIPNRWRLWFFDSLTVYIQYIYTSHLMLTDFDRTGWICNNACAVFFTFFFIGGSSSLVCDCLKQGIVLTSVFFITEQTGQEVQVV